VPDPTEHDLIGLAERLEAPPGAREVARRLLLPRNLSFERKPRSSPLDSSPPADAGQEYVADLVTGIGQAVMGVREAIELSGKAVLLRHLSDYIHSRAGERIGATQSSRLLRRRSRRREDTNSVS
jgi:hypothetical protein